MEYISRILGLATLQDSSSRNGNRRAYSAPLLDEQYDRDAMEYKIVNNFDNDIYRRPLKRALTESELDESAESEPAWQVNRRRNNEKSPLHRLPEEILSMIFDKSDLLSQQMVRQTCSRFAGVITNLDPKRIVLRASQPFDDCFDPRQIWICHGSTVERNKIRTKWGVLVRADKGEKARRIQNQKRAQKEATNNNTSKNTNINPNAESTLCNFCRWFEVSGQLDERLVDLKRTMYCYGCDEYHPRGMFSVTDRNGPWVPFLGYLGGSPKCVRWRGKIRLCAHVQVSWHDYYVKMNRLKEAGVEGVALPQLSCPKGCHWRGCTNSFPTSAGDFDSETTARPMLSPTFGAVARENRSTYNDYTMLLTWATRAFDIEPDPTETKGRGENDLVPLKTNKPFRDFLRTVDTESTGPSLCPHMSINDGHLFRPLQAPFCQCFADCNTKILDTESRGTSIQTAATPGAAATTTAPISEENSKAP